MKEEINITENEIENLYLRYITLRRHNGEIRQNYYFFADLKENIDMEINSNEGISRWFHLTELEALEMPFTSKYVIEHYLNIGCKTNIIYGGIANDETVVFVNMSEF